MSGYALQVEQDVKPAYIMLHILTWPWIHVNAKNGYILPVAKLSRQRLLVTEIFLQLSLQFAYKKYTQWVTNNVFSVYIFCAAYFSDEIKVSNH